MPTVAGGTAGLVKDTSATFTANINPNGAETKYQIEYGAGTTYSQIYPQFQKRSLLGNSRSW